MGFSALHPERPGPVLHADGTGARGPRAAPFGRAKIHFLLHLGYFRSRQQRLNDNLLGAFCSLVRRYVDEVGAATKEANDRIANATARRPIFRHFDIDEAVHSSSDGQKFEAAIPTINARHSSKYFGLKKGVVAYRLLANHVPLNARIIGANEHESHSVFDNALILSEALAELEHRGELASAEVLKPVSPVAWQHIHFYGRYQFGADFTPIDFTRLRQQLSSEEVSRLYVTADRSCRF